MKEAARIPWNECLRQERIRRNWRQQDLADQLGTTVITVKRWERGRQLPSSYFRQKLCALFEKSAEELGFVPEEVPSAEETVVEAPQEECISSSSDDVATLWNVPFPRNPFFTGREEVLADLHSMLTHTSTIAALTQSYALSGLGGIGKTHLAVEYAYRYRHDYQGVFWVQAETQTTLVASFVALAESLRLPERTEQDQNKVVAAVLRWFNRHQGWLLIFDNVEDLSLLRSFLPASGQGALLLTTRLQSLGTLAQAVEVSTMGMQEGIDFLLARTKRHRNRQEREAVLDPQEKVAIRAIVTEMGGLPLALEQAGAYIAVTQCSFADYLHFFQTAQHRLLDEHEPSSDHPLSVAKTFELVFQRLEQQNQVAAELLTACAFLAPEAIPDLFFLEGAPYLGPTLKVFATDRLAFHKAIKALLSSSLLQRHATEHTVTVHRLVQVVLKARLSETEQRTWIKRVVEAMNQLFPFDEITQAHYWQVGERLLPHALACLALTEQWDEDQTHALLLMKHVATYFSLHAWYAQAEQLFERFLRAGEDTSSSEPLLKAEVLHGLAALSMEQGQYVQAELLFQQVVHLRKLALGADHPLVANSLLWLGGLYWRQRLPERAEPVFLEALHTWEQASGLEDDRVSTALNTPSMADEPQDHYKRVEIMHQRFLRIFEQTAGPDSPNIAYPVWGLADIARRQGHYEQAEHLYQRALHIWEQALGSDHPCVAYLLNDLGNLCLEQGNYEQAELFYQRALTLRQQRLRPEHPDLAETLYDLARLRQVQQQDAEALSLYRQALTIREQALGTQHPRTKETHSAYKRLLREMEDKETTTKQG